MATTTYYVTAHEHDSASSRVAWLSGPYATHEEAIAMIRPVKDWALEYDPWMHFAWFGTASIDTPGEPRWPHPLPFERRVS